MNLIKNFVFTFVESNANFHVCTPINNACELLYVVFQRTHIMTIPIFSYVFIGEIQENSSQKKPRKVQKTLRSILSNKRSLIVLPETSKK